MNRILRSLLLVLLLGGLFGSGGAGVGAAQGSGAGCWTVFDYQTLFGADFYYAHLSAVAASGHEVWAVGGIVTKSETPERPLVAHWDGSKWNQAAGELGVGSLNDAVAVSPADVWSVGTTAPGIAESQPLIVHWDGKAWSNFALPPVDGSYSKLENVAASGPADVWATGSFTPAVGSPQQLIYHWDGSAWARVQPASDQLAEPQSIAAVSRDSAWMLAGGIYHWDGAAWSAYPVDPEVQPTQLQQLLVVAPDNIWALGSAGAPLVVSHWDGARWSGVAAPNIGSGTAQITTLAAAAPGDIWAGGFYSQGRSSQILLLAHWDGSKWSIASSPISTSGAAIYDAAANADGVWFVGRDYTGYPNHNDALLMRYGKTACSGSHPTPLQPLAPPVALPGDGSRAFPQTGKTVSGVFLKYWDEHGGLVQQGYPISDVIGERSDLDGKVYTVQYFERAVFEYHPENQPPYDVLLSQLGKLRYRAIYPNGADEQRPNNNPGSVLFPETGHRLGGAFLAYWQDYGGLSQQGYPISDEFTEVSPTDGKLYTVQYFERAAFEFHPELNGTAYFTLLSLLGRFAYNAKYKTPSFTGPTTIDLNIGTSYAAGHYVVWEDVGSPMWPIYAYDTASQQRFLVFDRPGAPFTGRFVTDGKTVIWDTQTSTKLRRFDLDARQEIAPISLSVANPALTMAVDGDKLYYSVISQDVNSGILDGVGIVEHNITSGAERMLTRYAFGKDSSGVPVIDTIIDGIRAHNGTIVSTERRYYTFTDQSYTLTTIHALQPDGYLTDTIINSGKYDYATYTLSEDGTMLAYAFLPSNLNDPANATNPNLYAHLRKLQPSDDQLLSSVPTSAISIAAGRVVWSEDAFSAFDQPQQTVIKQFDTATRRTTTLTSAATYLIPTGLVNSGHALAYSSYDPSRQANSLNLLALP